MGIRSAMGMGMGWEWELSAWEWELRRGSGENIPIEIQSWTSKSAKTQILFSFGWIISRSYQSCTQWLTVSMCASIFSCQWKSVLSTAGRMLEKRRANLSPAAVNSFYSCTAIWSEPRESLSVNCFASRHMLRFVSPLTKLFLYFMWRLLK